MHSILLTGVSTAKDISDELIWDEDDAHEGAKALRTLLLGRTFSLPPADAGLFRFPVTFPEI